MTKEKEVFILRSTDEHEFTTNGDNLLEQGFILSSSNCGVINPTTDWEFYYIGIFVKQ